MEFVPFPKLKRISRGMVVTEKLDGTNAQITITEDGQFLTGSRKRWIVPGDDNFGFAAWAHARRDELTEVLGVGSHFGEWWGQGIQRNYGLEEKRFSLFNTARWAGVDLPDGVYTVPILYQGPFSTETIDWALEKLHHEGSVAVPGFMNPEGVVIWHENARVLFKKTLDHNDEHKFMHQSDPRG